MYQFYPIIYLSIIALVLLAGLIGYGISNRRSFGAREFTLAMGGAGWWVYSHAMQLMSLTFEAKLFWSNMGFIGLGIASVSFLLCALKFGGWEYHLKDWYWRVGFLVYVGFALLFFTDGMHGLLRTNFVYGTGIMPYGLTYEHGILFPLYAAFVYLLNGSSLLFLAVGFFRQGELYRRHMLTLMICLLVPITANVVYLSGVVSDLGFDPTPLFVGIAALVASFGLYRYRLLATTPMARDLLVERVRSGVIVLDPNGIIVDVNPAALEQFGLDLAEIIGKPCQGIEALEDAVNPADGLDYPLKLSRFAKNKERLFEVDCFPVHGAQGETLGQLLVIDDITERQLAMNQIFEQQRNLSIAQTQRRIGQQMQDGFVETIVRLLELHDTYTKGHSAAVADWAHKIGEELGLMQDSIRLMHHAGLIHDMGKILVPQDVLNKPGKLTDAEYDSVKQHPHWAAQALGDAIELAEMGEIVRHHHEWYDGSGYPDGLKGKDIPLISRILAVADAWDSMVRDRPYRKALSEEVARQELLDGRGSQFDPQIVDVFLSMVETE